MNLSAEELKYYTNPKMQEFFREMMGSPQFCDKVIHNTPDDIEIGLVVDPLIEPGFAYIRWDWGASSHMSFYKIMVDEFYGYLPLTIDPSDDERLAKGENPRGLWGMCDWNTWHGEIMPSGNVWMYFSADYMAKRAPKIIASPTLALLKTLAHQLGAEVKHD